MKPNGVAMRAIREAKGISLRMLEKRTQLNRGYLSRLERGERGSSEDTLKDLAGALDVDIAAITHEEAQ